MTSPHDRLDDAMDARRLDLDLRWREVADRARLNEATLRAIRVGRNKPSQLAKRRIEEALQWASGSVDAVMAGGEPKPLKAAESDRIYEDSVDRLEQRVRTPGGQAALRGAISVLQSQLDVEPDPEEQAALRGLIAKLGGPLPEPPSTAERDKSTG
jgi:hypothetical protein